MLDKTLKKVIRTCPACPSQWDAWTTEGDYLYIRYRHGDLSVSKKGEPVWEHHIFEKQVGDDLDGLMMLPEVLNHTGMKLTDDAEVHDDLLESCEVMEEM